MLVFFSFELHSSKRFLAIPAMDASKAANPTKELPLGLDPNTEEEYASLSKLLQEFTSISSIDKAWTFKSNTGMDMACDLCNIFFFSYSAF